MEDERAGFDSPYSFVDLAVLARSSTTAGRVAVLVQLYLYEYTQYDLLYSYSTQAQAQRPDPIGCIR